MDLARDQGGRDAFGGTRGDDHGHPQWPDRVGAPVSGGNRTGRCGHHRDRATHGRPGGSLGTRSPGPGPIARRTQHRWRWLSTCRAIPACGRSGVISLAASGLLVVFLLLPWGNASFLLAIVTVFAWI